MLLLLELISSIFKMWAVLIRLLTTASAPSMLWTKTASMFFLLLPSPSTAPSMFVSPRGILLTVLFFLSHLTAAASASSVFVVPSTELWTGTRVEVGCYADQDKQVSWSQIFGDGNGIGCDSHSTVMLMENGGVLCRPGQAGQWFPDSKVTVMMLLVMTLMA